MLNFWKRRFVVTTFFLVAASGLFSPPAQSMAQFATDARWAPPQTNMLVLINSKRLFGSEIAKKERAADASRAAFDAGVSVVTPDVDRLMIASNVDFEVMHTLWTAAVYSREQKKFDLIEIANKVGSSVDTIGRRDMVLLPSDAMLVDLAPATAGVMKPGNRQAVANWLKGDLSSGSSRLPSYLKEAVSFADANADIIIALDLEDALPPAEIRNRLSKFSTVPVADLDSVATILNGIKGITLGVTFRQSITGSIKIDFQSGAQGLDKIGKDLLIEILQKRGMMIDDLDNWAAKTTAEQLLLTGPLSISGVRAIGSMVSQPLLPEITAGAEETSANAAYARSLTYFRSLESYVNEVSTKNSKLKSLMAYSKWFENYAHKIDSFSVLDVDPDLVTLGSGISNSLREMAEITRTAMLEAKAARSQLENYGRDGYSYDGYGYDNGYAGRYRVRSREIINTQAETGAEEQARVILKSISEELSSARKSMSLKYGVDF
jgi:hypothetical protein